jgi:predicted amidophosphoribosyltransferase
VLKYLVAPIAAILAHWAANSFIFDSHVIAPVGAHYRRRHLFRTFGQSRELQRAIFDPESPSCADFVDGPGEQAATGSRVMWMQSQN